MAHLAGAAPEENSRIDHDELIGRLDALFNPEPDADGFMREWPQITDGPYLEKG